MEINPCLQFSGISGNTIPLEIKPMRGIDYDHEVQRYEQAYRMNGLDGLQNINTESSVTQFEHILFNKVGDYKASLDSKMELFTESINTKGELSGSELLNLQYQMGLYVVEVTAVSSGSDKVSDGIITLFQTK